MAARAIPLDVGAAPVPEGRETEARALPRQDPFGLDPELRQRVLPAVRFLHDRYWRGDGAGIQHVPARGPLLLGAHHSRAVPLDGAMIVTPGELRRPRPLRFLFQRLAEKLAP